MEKHEWVDGSEFIKYSGRSSDYRTNRWKIICPVCGTINEPKTTVFNFQTIDCKKKTCNAAFTVNYNEKTIFLVSYGL